jgi:hypothetical protein
MAYFGSTVFAAVSSGDGSAAWSLQENMNSEAENNTRGNNNRFIV